MNSRTSDFSSGTAAGRFPLALSRFKYNDYKTLMRSITRRFDSPQKVNIAQALGFNIFSYQFLLFFLANKRV